MRVFWKIATAAPLAMLLGSVHAVEPRIALFDFGLADTSLEGATNGPRSDQQARLAQITDRLRDRLAKSGRVAVVDITPVATQARAAGLRNCGACDAQFASQVGADFAGTGWVQKVSNLILDINVNVSDAKAGPVISFKNWSRAIDWLVRYDLLASAGQGVFQ
jgi:hypothetical protein